MLFSSIIYQWHFPHFLDCTYSHFESNSQCPTCGKTLTENDFTELVIAQANSTTDIAKSSLQALFSKHSKSPTNSKALPLSDLCYSMVRQIDAMKQSTKFLLKQLLMDSSSANRRNLMLRRQMEMMKNEVTQVKQHYSAQRLQYEQMNNNLQQKLAARESTNSELQQKIKEQQKMLEQFQRLHNGRAAGITPLGETDGDRISHNIPPSSGNGPINSHVNSRDNASVASYHRPPQNPPLKGFIAQKQAHNLAQQQAYNNSMRNPGATLGSFRRSKPSNGPGGYMPPTQSPYTSRPYSSASGESMLSNIPRIRELSSSTGFNFTGTSASSQHQNHHLNKRRRATTPNSTNSSYYSMSPNTAFTLNQGPHSVGNLRRR